ncbi:hypothetical protein GBF35_31345 [Nonomuraea phyllanthi]|uniref:hypothetical protein n=1 Tax=Nonomuraea phyllanthi TaxID=2219224 RepID=UPI001293191D|nr:hypothetical protein [Nonomuraea phyllanthi]QFY10509.1 hypothetical protein GBF35_31345 [Nonomuraea phyllanthi]
MSRAVLRAVGVRFGRADQGVGQAGGQQHADDTAKRDSLCSDEQIVSLRRILIALGPTFVAVLLAIVLFLPDAVSKDAALAFIWTLAAAICATLPSVAHDTPLNTPDSGWRRWSYAVLMHADVVLASSISAILAALNVFFDDGVLLRSLNLGAVPLVLGLGSMALVRAQIRRRYDAVQLLPMDDLEHRLGMVARRLSESAEEFALLQGEVQARTVVAQQLAREAEENHRYAAEKREEADAVDRLVATRAEPLLREIDRRSRKGQIAYLVIGAALGTLFQLIADRFF